MAFSLRPPPPYSALDALAVSVLTALALAGLHTSFDGIEWIAAGAGGLAVGLGWAYALTALRLNGWTVVLTLFIPYVLTAGAFALGVWTPWLGFPTAGTVEKVVVGTATSWRQLVETVPTLDSAGVVLLIPYLLAMLCGALGGTAAVTTRRPVLPALPLVLALAVALVVGTADPFSVLVQGVGFGAVALLWIGHRSARWLTDEDRSGRVSTGRTVASVVVVGLAVALVLPLASQTPARPRWVVREALTPYDSSRATTPLTVFRSFRPGHEGKPAHEPLFEVKGAPEDTLLRIAVLDGYDGERFYAVSDRPDDVRDRFMRISSRIDDPGRGRRKQALVKVRGTWLLDWMPVVGRVQSLEFLRDRSRSRRDAIRYNRSTNAALLRGGGLVVGDEYTVETLVARDRLRPRMDPWPERDEDLYEAAAFLDPVLATWADPAKDPMVQVFEIADRMHDLGAYSDGEPGWQERWTAGQDPERLVQGFLQAPQMVGNDEQYASAMALMANRLGVPARVVVGARVRRKGVVRPRHIGAWVEVRVADGSWRTLPTGMFMSRTPPLRDDPEPQMPQQQPQQPKDPDQPEKPRKRKRDKERKNKDRKEEERQQEDEQPWWLLGLLPVVAVGSVPVAKRVRRSRRRGARTPAGRALGGWAEVVDAATDLGVPLVVRPRPEQAAALGVDPALGRAADAAAFTDQTPDLGDDHWARVEAARATLRERTPVWRRWLAVVNPRSLLRRGVR